MRTEEIITPTPNEIHQLQVKIAEQAITISRLKHKVRIAKEAFDLWAQNEQEQANDPNCSPYMKVYHKGNATLYSSYAELIGKEVL